MDGDQARVLLGVPAAASAAEIKTAFRNEARRAHPDGGGCETAFRLLVTARDVALGEVSCRSTDPKTDPQPFSPTCSGDLGRRFRDRACAPPRPLLDLRDSPSRVPVATEREAPPSFEEILSSVRSDLY